MQLKYIDLKTKVEDRKFNKQKNVHRWRSSPNLRLEKIWHKKKTDHWAQRQFWNMNDLGHIWAYGGRGNWKNRHVSVLGLEECIDNKVRNWELKLSKKSQRWHLKPVEDTWQFEENIVELKNWDFGPRRGLNDAKILYQAQGCNDEAIARELAINQIRETGNPKTFMAGICRKKVWTVMEIPYKTPPKEHLGSATYFIGRQIVFTDKLFDAYLLEAQEKITNWPSTIDKVLNLIKPGKKNELNQKINNTTLKVYFEKIWEKGHYKKDECVEKFAAQCGGDGCTKQIIRDIMNSCQA